jgi:hypothetical protein
VAFLLHDDTLPRTTNGQGKAGAQPWSALSQLDAGSWHSRQYAGEPMPAWRGFARPMPPGSTLKSNPHPGPSWPPVRPWVDWRKPCGPTSLRRGHPCSPRSSPRR